MRYYGLTSIIREILDDGEWHNVLDLVIQTRHCIPPELAVKAYEIERHGKGIAGLSLTWCLNKGRRRVVMKVISALLHRRNPRNPPQIEVKRDSRDNRTITAVRKL